MSPFLQHTRTLLAVGSALLASAAVAASPFTDRLLRDEALWGDGKAEVAVFDATEKRYGIARQTEVRHIVVRENFAAKGQVKADDWRAPGAYPVIKLNQIITVPTGTYRYDQGHSSFWRADSGALIKFSQTTNDSCGLTYKQGNFDGDEWRYRAFTYWEGMSEVEARETPPEGALFYDELPFRLRLLDWGKVTRFTAPLLPSVIGSKADRLVWAEAIFTLSRVRPGDGTREEGRGDDAWRVVVRHAQGTDTLVFATATPHGLRRWERWDGSVLTLRQAVRLPYWKLNQPGDERYLVPGATYP